MLDLEEYNKRFRRKERMITIFATIGGIGAFAFLLFLCWVVVKVLTHYGVI